MNWNEKVLERATLEATLRKKYPAAEHDMSRQAGLETLEHRYTDLCRETGVVADLPVLGRKW